MTTLDRLSSKVRLAIHWTKAHVGHEGNEKADLLAKEGTEKTTYHIEPIIPVPKSYIRNKIHLYIQKEWTSRWNSLTEARQTKLFFPQPNPKLSKRLLMYDRQTCAKLFRWISGHSFHRYHNHLTNPESFTNPKCRLCNETKEETSHLFAFCQALSPVRMSKIGSERLSEHFSWTPNQLLTMINAIDQICPEEGTVNMQNNSQGLNPTANDDALT
jgi:ribonuclease HI